MAVKQIKIGKASQKHEKDVERTDCRFNETGKICCILYLLDLNLILVASNSQINPDVSQCCKKKTNDSTDGYIKRLNIWRYPQRHRRQKRTIQAYWDYHSNNAFVSHKFLISEMKMESEKSVYTYGYDSPERRGRKQNHHHLKSLIRATGGNVLL